MVEIIFFEGEHFGVVLAFLVPPFQILLLIAKVFNILVLDISMGSFLLDYLVDLTGVKVNLGGGIL